MIGQLLTGRYLILKQLGAGGFSETYLARDKYLPHHPLCVVKWLKPPSDGTISRDTARQLFETEAQILGQLGQQHAQIPTLFAYCCDADQAYLVQEYIEGINLGDWVAQGRRLSATGAIELLLEVLPILDYIHSQQVIHRDIKPSNLIRRHSDGKMVLIDFGAACFLSAPDAGSQVDPPSITIGTPGYMPDEQQLGMSQLNSDLYALGMLVLHFLTGVKPSQFQQDLISGELDWQAYLQGQTIAPDLIAVLDRLVRTHVHDRYASAAQALESLRTLINTRKPKQKPKVKQWLVPRRRHWFWEKIPAITGVLLLGIAGGSYWTHLNANAYSVDVQLSLLKDVSLPFRVVKMVISPDEQFLVTAGNDQSLWAWSLPDEKKLKSLSGQTASVTALDISQDSRLLVSGASDQTIRVWDIATEHLIASFVGQSGITAVAISPDAQTVVSGSQNGVIQFWDLSTQKLLRTLVVPNTAITALTYGMTATQLISASSDRQIQAWDLQTGKLYRTFAGHTAAVLSLQAIDNHTFLSFSEDRTLIWDLKDEELMQVCANKTVESVAASLSHDH
ncbi:MAG TPA: serine/threonine-protein kinase, partial [Allocoleopsis sp.]